MRKTLIALLIIGMAGFSSACVASKKFVRNEVKTSSDVLSGRIDTNEGEIKETRDSVDRLGKRVTGVDSRVSDLDSRTTQAVSSLTEDVQSADQKAIQAQAAAERTAGDLTMLNQQFEGRNQFAVKSEATVQFRFDSAQLESQYYGVMDEVAQMLTSNPDAIVVLQGHTDSKGNAAYNLKLGERRVDAVRQYLAVEKNVPVYRIHEISFGMAKPIASNDSREGREKNRAVTLTLLVPATNKVAQGR